MKDLPENKHIDSTALLQHPEETIENYNYDSFGQCEGGAPEFTPTTLDGQNN